MDPLNATIEEFAAGAKMAKIHWSPKNKEHTLDSQRCQAPTKR
jgi:hypothetical protein